MCSTCEEGLSDEEEAEARADMLIGERDRRGEQGVRLAVVASEILNRSVSTQLDEALRTAVTEVIGWVNEPLAPYLQEEG